MGALTTCKAAANRILAHINVRVDSRTAERQEARRLIEVERRGWFDRPPFDVLEIIQKADVEPIVGALPEFQTRLDTFSNEDRNDVAYSYDNSFFTSPDSEILYTLARSKKPRKIVEVGSGNSTKLFRQAIQDGDFACELISIDPSPRCEIRSLADEVISERVEALPKDALAARLESGDFLFIDSSHEVRSGNDVLYLFFSILPLLTSGVFVHVHDVFLPFDYPRVWVIDFGRNFGEQYLLQAMLDESQRFDVIWPGHFIQRTRRDFSKLFPRWKGDDAKSFWMQRR